MIGKILFIDDEFKGWDTPHVISNTVNRLIKDNSLTRGFCFFPKTFEEAVKEIIDAGDGRDYSWFIIDRNLGKFSDITNVEKEPIKVNDVDFTKAFFDDFKGFEGDYLYFLLRKGGVPLEKICFLTANNYKNPGEASKLKSTPFVFAHEKPRVIEKDSVKSDDSNNSKTALDDDIDCRQHDKDEAELYDLIKNSLEHQICFKHKVVFSSQKIISIFENSKLLYDFKQLLIKIERNESFQPQDGTVLRNMLELILEEWKRQHNLGETTIRKLLNDYYTFKLKHYNQTYEDWFKAYDRCGHLPGCSDEEILVKYFDSEKQKCTDPKKLKKIPPSKDLADNVIKFSYFILEGMLYYCYQSKHCNKSKNSNNSSSFPPPKYIFAYIDNIYTVTSECSSHGHNLTTTQGLSPEGWKALIFGMLQILLWIAQTPPNP